MTNAEIAKLIATETEFILFKRKNIATKNERIAREEKDFYAGLEENCLDKMIWAAREIGELLDQIESETEDLAGHYRYLEKYKKELRKYIPIKAKAKVEEIDVADYAVSVEAQEVAVNAEIDDADAAAEVADELVAMFERGEKTFTFAEIENAGKAVKANTHRFEVGKWYYINSSPNCLPDYKVIRREKKSVTLIDEDGDIVRKKIVPYSVDYIEEIHFGCVDLEETDAFYLSADYVCTDIDAIKEGQRPATKVASLGSETPNCLDTADLLTANQ